MTSSLREPLSLTTRALGVAGLLPFLACALAIAAGPPSWQGAATRLLVAYGAVIVSFLGGIHWGVPTEGSHDEARAWGVVPPLLAWPLLMVPSEQMALLGLAASLLLCWAVDRTRLPRLGLSALMPLRTMLTGVAVACCLLGAALS